MRTLTVWDAGEESALDGYRADQLMITMAAAVPGRALLRLWSRPSAALSAGRYHRIPEGAHEGLQRRLSGGRVVPVGPGVLGVSIAVGSAEWLAAGGAALRPDQILNRALRPLLAVLRGIGVDAFYGGRDLVVCGGRPFLHASFCPFADGAILVEQMLATYSSFVELERLAASMDPAGIAVAAPGSFATAVPLRELANVPPRGWWTEQLASEAARAFGADAECASGTPAGLAHAVAADQATYVAFAYERKPRSSAVRTAAAIGMLGIVEAGATVVDGIVRGLEVSGDVIAPFETLEALAAACEGKRAEAPALRRIAARELAAPGRFVLGILDLEDLVARIV